MATPRPEHVHASVTSTPKTPPPYPRQQDDGETDVLSSANCPSTVNQQQRCHSTSTSAWIPSWPPMPCPLLHRVATARQEKIQLPIAEQNFLPCPLQLLQTRIELILMYHPTRMLKHIVVWRKTTTRRSSAHLLPLSEEETTSNGSGAHFVKPFQGSPTHPSSVQGRICRK